MAGKSNDLSAKLLNYVLRNGSYTPSTTVYMALLHNNGAATANFAGTALTSTYEFESSSSTQKGYAGYARATIVSTAGTLFGSADSTTGIIKNSQSIVFNGHTGGTSLGTVTGFVLVTSSTSATGDILYFGTVNNKVIDINNTPPTVAGSALTIQES